MSFGKLYGYPGNPRTNSLLVIAKENNLDIELVDTKANPVTSSADYLKYNKLGKIPTFVGSDGFVLTEVIAIAVYLTSQNEKTTFLGKTKQDYASILRWMSFANSEIISCLGPWFRPLAGMEPYNKKQVETSAEKFEKVIKVLEDHFLINTYLVGERVTLADIFVAAIVGRGYEFVLDKAWRSEHPNVNRWFETVYNQSFYKSVVTDQKFIDEAVKYTPPAKEKKEAAPKQEKKETPAAKPKAKEPEDDEEEEEKPVEKAKHPLELLGKPTFALDDWKRKYKNEETREVALPWFWENMNFEEFSIWRVDYKYNDELTQVFMTSNLIGGFFARLEGSRKYIMGCASVYGQANDSVIQGAFVIRGQEALPAFDVAPDYESYDFKKLDPKDSSDKEFLDSMWAWDKPVEVNGKSYDHADGKIFV